VFMAVAVWESFRPRSPLAWPTGRRWGSHALILTLCGIAQTLTFRITPVALAIGVADSPFGLLNRPALPLLVRSLLAFLLLDLARYVMHRVFHSIALLWR